MDNRTSMRAVADLVLTGEADPPPNAPATGQ
jgi:hypothetical protein